jgi:hypothetical protein
MRARVRDNGIVVCLAAVAIVTVGWLTLYGFAWTDYETEAQPAFAALVAGHVGTFLRLAPAYGGSFVLRAPFALLADLWGGGALAVYRLVALPCLLAAAAFAVWLVADMRAAGRSRLARGVAFFLAVANPVTLPTLEDGHPEELLGAVLCAAAVLLAVRRRPLWAALALGLAVANKPWALLAVGPVLLATPGLRMRLTVTTIAAAVCAAVLAPLVLAGGGDFVAATRETASNAGPIFQPWQAWWFLGSHGHAVVGLFGNVKPGYRSPPEWVEQVAHPLIILLAVPLTWAAARVRPRRADLPLLLLVLLMLLRFLLDPWDTIYYPLPFLFALLAWEATSRDHPPVLALTASFVVWWLFQWVPLRVDADVQALAFLACALPALAATALAVYAPGAWPRRRPAGAGPALAGSA